MIFNPAPSLLNHSSQTDTVVSVVYTAGCMCVCMCVCMPWLMCVLCAPVFHPRPRMLTLAPRVERRRTLEKDRQEQLRLNAQTLLENIEQEKQKQAQPRLNGQVHAPAGNHGHLA